MSNSTTKPTVTSTSGTIGQSTSRPPMSTTSRAPSTPITAPASKPVSTSTSHSGSPSQSPRTQTVFQTGPEAQGAASPKAVGGDQKSATKGEEVVKENKVITAA